MIVSLVMCLLENLFRNGILLIFRFILTSFLSVEITQLKIIAPEVSIAELSSFSSLLGLLELSFLIIVE
jgi:hypothetical protein